MTEPEPLPIHSHGCCYLLVDTGGGVMARVPISQVSERGSAQGARERVFVFHHSVNVATMDDHEESD